MSGLIKSMEAFEEYDSNGGLTISGKLTLDSGLQVTASVPNYQSVNKLAAQYIETAKAVKYVNQLFGPKLVKVNVQEYKKIDFWLNEADKTEKKEVLGANTLLLISKLVYKAAAKVADLPLYRFLNQVYTSNFDKLELKKMPSPIYTLITGGKHGAKALNFQEFSVIFSTGIGFSQSLERAVSLHRDLQTVFEYRNIFSGVGDDGAYVPNLSSNYDALEIIKEAILKNSYKIGIDIFFALDCAAQNYYKVGKYYLSQDIGSLDTSHLMEFYEKLFREYRFLVLEDPFAVEDSKGWQMAMQKFGSKAYILGDDLLSMNEKQLTVAINKKLCSTVDIKIFQRGTIWDTFGYITLARKAGMKILLSQSSIETNEDFLADLAVGIQAEFVKFGAPIRGERVAKYNRLLAIENELFS